MRTLASVIVEKKNTISPEFMGPWMWGWEGWRDDSQVVRYTSDVRDVILAGLTFSRRAMNIEAPETDAGGSTISYKVTVENLDRLITSYLEAGELKGQPCALYRMHADHLDSLDKAVIWRARIIDVTGDGGDISFSCGLFDLTGVQIPGGKWNRTRCHWKYSAPGNRNDTCAYAGGLTTCRKDITDCIAHANKERFGAFPGMPVRRL